MAATLDGLYDGYRAEGVPLWFGEWGGVTDVPAFDAYTHDLLAILAERSAGSALWAWSRGGGFSFLDDEGRPKPELAAIGRAPFPSRLPNPAQSQVIGDDEALHVSFVCVQGADVELVVAGDVPVVADVSPAGALEAQGTSHHRWSAICTGDDEVELVVGGR